MDNQCHDLIWYVTKKMYQEKDFNPVVLLKSIQSLRNNDIISFRTTCFLTTPINFTFELVYLTVYLKKKYQTFLLFVLLKFIYSERATRIWQNLQIFV